MNTEKIEQLLEKYFDGETSLEEEALLRNYFQNRDIPEHLQSYRDQFGFITELSHTKPADDFNPMGKIESDKNAAKPHSGLITKSGHPETGKSTGWGTLLNTRLAWTLRIAAGFILLLVGFSAGLLVNQQQNVSTEQVAVLQQEIQQMKSVLVYGTENRLTASERISAVKLSDRVPESTEGLGSEITEILIYTMNNDQNINVREAAAEALFRFRNEEPIRKALVNSLSRQRDPLMQMTLINMLVELKEKSAINEMQKLLMDSDTREVVKTRLELGIAELKT